MSLTYPLTPPSTPAPKSVVIRAKSLVGIQRSPFSGVQTVYSNTGEWFEMDVSLPPMQRAAAEQWVGFLLGLNGVEGTFLYGDPVATSPLGTWAQGSPSSVVSGAHAAGVKTVTVSDMLTGATGKAGDWIQFGTGESAHLHKLVQDFTAAGGTQDLEIWPRTKAALANGDAYVISNAVGAWRLMSNDREWTIEEAQIYGISFSAMEAF